jgi:hypothetical protein
MRSSWKYPLVLWLALGAVGMLASLRSEENVTFWLGLALFPFFALMHYFLWGRSLTAQVRLEQVLERIREIEGSEETPADRGATNIRAPLPRETKDQGANHASNGIRPARRG